MHPPKIPVMNNLFIHPSSFKDPAGFIFCADGLFYRQINQSNAADYELLVSSGLYEKLVKLKLLLHHTETNSIKANAANWYKTLLPEQLPFIAYPYEWSFNQLKDAALLTLRIQKEALQHGMSLKDATPFNVQWQNGKPVFIDTLSFEKYNEGEPWVAYKQYCENFLAPLVLMKYCHAELNKLLLHYPAGIPLPVVSSLLPLKTKFNIGIYLHIHLQAKYQKNQSGDASASKRRLKLTQQINILDNLTGIINKLQPLKEKTTWNNYYEETILSKGYLQEKEILVKNFLSSLTFKTVADLGANTGEFSLLAAPFAEKVIAADFDADCINNLYLSIRKNKIKNVFPIVLNVVNPTPAIGWANTERSSFWERANADVIMALALIHHLVISANVTLEMIAALLQKKCNYLIIEFVPKSDPKVQQLLSYRKDVFADYDETNFEKIFAHYFHIERKTIIPNTHRSLFLMKKINNNV